MTPPFETPAGADLLPDLFQGPRLDLALVPVASLLARAASEGPVPLGCDDPHDVLHPEHSPLRRRVDQVRDDPDVNPWLIRVAVARDTGAAVGLANFHDRPDADGMVEIGYRVLPEHRRQGYGREIAAAMWDGVAGHPLVRTLRATVSPDNAASIAIIEGAGLVHVGEQWDDEDGLELVYEIAATDYAARRSSTTP